MNNRANPLNRLTVMGLRLCGIAELPFCPSPKNSSTSSIQSAGDDGNSVAQRSTPWGDHGERRNEFRVPVTLDNLGERVAGFNPSFSHTIRSIFGSTWACVPTAPLFLPTRIRSRVCVRRSSARRIRHTSAQASGRT